MAADAGSAGESASTGRGCRIRRRTRTQALLGGLAWKPAPFPVAKRPSHAGDARPWAPSTVLTATLDPPYETGGDIDGQPPGRVGCVRGAFGVRSRSGWDGEAFQVLGVGGQDAAAGGGDDDRVGVAEAAQG